MANCEESVRLAREALVASKEARFRRALEHGLEHTGEKALDAVIGALGTLIEDNEGAIAFEMAQTGIRALIERSPQDQEAAQAWHAVSAGCDPSQDPISILDLAAEVERTAYLHATSNPQISPTGPAAVAALRTRLVERFGESVPFESALLEWFSGHNESRSSGGLTTAGIVARIVHHGQLFGARGDELDRTLKRVDRVLSRARKPQK